MRYIRPDVVALVSCAVLLAACGDDQPVTSTDTTPQITSATNQTTNQVSSTSGPQDTDPTTGTPTEPGTSSLGTESNGTDTTGTPGTSTTDPGGTDTDTTGPDPSTTTTDPGTSTMTMPCEEANCPMGQFCDPVSDQCIPGCNDDSDCNAPSKCDVGSNTCKGCLGDGDCPLGTVCDAGECTPGCNDMQPCQDGLACCSNTCLDLLVDVDNCQACGNVCPVPPNAAATCAMGQCGLGACKAPWNDCDKDPANGCENQGQCQCTPGAQMACYTGPNGTQGVGICKEGVQTCNPQGTGFGPCTGEVTPNPTEICANNLDDNCNGQTDEDSDKDGDGYTVCGGDCCDEVGPSCLNPVLVNPGAFEVGGNMVDDDCDGTKDNPVASCDGGLASNSGTPIDYAKAIDLCQTTTENPPQNQKKWGVISGTLTRADGSGAIDAQARSIRPGFGTNVVPQQNARLAILSTGNAADSNDANPPYADFQTGKDNGANSAAPADWLAANGGNFPNAPGCPGAGSNAANNSAMLKLRVRVPTNAKSFNVQMYFYSAEWPEWTCTAYNDMFVTLVNSNAAGNPADRNIAIYTTPNNQKYPVGVNLVKAATGLFTQCKNGTFGCSGGNGGNYNGCLSQAGLAGTGFDILEGGCGNNNTTGGGTGWLKMAGNVNGGEVMEIRFAIWDTADGVYDSLVLLDDFVWSVQASQPGVQPN
ncbi:choice-of-anchor L domain-containing protein [Nannocystis bainbridge]|uniref:Choice-of-anchor L domain-containing protein n=1 Tax=Nannocystis bainbridge TaxID=2995303 RepID=A0ABT5DS08_9BACT|nr:choice-of-anchor L domain-containing protein [Nannocystis bainbridge]MDC0715955.1 choice-of-anchor L domain-containing protein [Nannocystis bainbridge]